MASDNSIQMEGIVVNANKDRFQVKINDNYTVLCTLSGKIRQNSVKILLDDHVTVEISPYDTSKGRIVFRNR